MQQWKITPAYSECESDLFKLEEKKATLGSVCDCYKAEVLLPSSLGADESGQRQDCDLTERMSTRVCEMEDEEQFSLVSLVEANGVVEQGLNAETCKLQHVQCPSFHCYLLAVL